MHIEFCSGNSVLHVFGQIHPFQRGRKKVSGKELVEEALEMLTEAPKDGQHALIHE